MISSQVTGREVNARFDAMPDELRAAVAEKVAQFTVLLWDKIVDGSLAGQILQRRTGDLAHSIQAKVESEGEATVGTVYSDGSVPYARILEEGGTTRPHDIVPTKAQILHFLTDGGDVFAKIVHHPGSVIPEFAYMRSPLAEMVPEIEAGFRELVGRIVGAP